MAVGERSEHNLNELKVPFKDGAKAIQIAESPCNSSESENIPNGKELDRFLLGLSRKLLMLEALVNGNARAFSLAGDRRNDADAERAKVALDFLSEWVLEVIAISKLQNSPLTEINSEIIEQYNSLHSTSALVVDCARARGSTPTRLSKRELEIVKCLAEGNSNKEIAVALGLSVKTVETYRARAMGKLNAHSLSDVLRFALRRGLLDG